MKVYKKLLIWVAISLMFQMAVLWFMDNVYLKNRGKIIEVTKYEEKENRPVSRDVSSLVDYTGISVSYDSGFAGYISNGDLKIIGLSEGKKDKIIDKGKKAISFFKWLPDRNMVLYAFVGHNNGKSVVNVETFDADTSIIRDYPQITVIREDARVIGVELSPLTNTVYMIIQAANGYDEIFKYDIVENLKRIATKKNISHIYHLIYTDNLIYQTNEKKIFIMGGNGEELDKSEYFGEGYVLLGSDFKGNIYLGEKDKQQNIKKIIFGKITDSFKKEYKSAGFNGDVQLRNIRITPDSRIFVILEKENMVHDILNGHETEYLGKFIQITQKYIVSVENGKLIFTQLSDLH